MIALDLPAAALAAAHAWFHRYVATFAGADGTLVPMQQLKYDHSLRVAETARQIAAGEAWPAGRVRLAEAAGLLHDAGRFSQYAEFRTFVDTESVDHACRSCAVLAAEQVLADWPAAERAAVLTAVRHHNAREVPPGLPAEHLPLLELVRDADKLDILEVFDDAIRHRRIDLYPEIAFRVELDGPPSPAVLERMRERRPVSYADIRSLADFLLVQVNWMHHLTYGATCRLVVQRQALRRLGELLPQTAVIGELLGLAAAEIERRAAERGGGPGRPARLEG